MIHGRCNEMHGAAMDTHPFVQRALVGMQAGEGWQQRGVDIHQAAFVVAHEAFAEDTHEAGEDDQIGRKTVDALGQRGIEGLAPGEGLVVDVMRGDAGLGCCLQALGIRPVADHGGDVDGQIAGVAGGDQRLHVAATAGNQDDDILHFKKLTGKKIVLTTECVSRERPRPWLSATIFAMKSSSAMTRLNSRSKERLRLAGSSSFESRNSSPVALRSWPSFQTAISMLRAVL